MPVPDSDVSSEVIAGLVPFGAWLDELDTEWTDLLGRDPVDSDLVDLFRLIETGLAECEIDVEIREAGTDTPQRLHYIVSPRGSISANRQSSGDHTETKKPPETQGSEGSGELVISSSIGLEGLEPPTNAL